MDRRTLGMAAVVLVVAGMVGGILLTSLASGGLSIGGSATPTPTESDYVSRAFRPTTTITVPSIWVVTVDQLESMQISPLITEGTASPAPADFAGIFLLADPRAAVQDPACTTKPDPTVGTDAKSIASWVAARPGLTSTEPKAAQIGGLSGWEVDLTIAPSWTTSCPFASGSPSVSLLANDAGTVRWVVFGQEKMRLTMLDKPGGGTVAVLIDTTDGQIFDSLVGEAAPIVASIRFAPS